MLYHSTRNKGHGIPSRNAILQGICEDGGLFVSDSLGQEKFPMGELSHLTYSEIAEKVLGILLSDYSEEEIRSSVRDAYQGKFETKDLTPLSEIGDQYLLELYHGPTSAFKDLALCMLPQLMSRALGEGQKVMILTATSGDTGKAALAGFAGARDIGITVFYPHEKVSDIQYLQMATQRGDNVAVAAVRGNFDDCQTGVKEIFASATEEILREDGTVLSSANSINVGRLVPQVVYYFEAYRQLLVRGVLKNGDLLDFCVPTGNFGDILAGYYAKCLGLPVGKLIIASNENNVLYDFMQTGTYDRNRPFVKTISPSMDILISSNLERLLYYASGRNPEAVASWMRSLKETGSYSLPQNVMDRIHQQFEAAWVRQEEVRDTIREAWENCKRLIDPHTAVAYHVSRGRKTPTVVLSTASPFKFAKDVYTSIFGSADLGDGFAYMKALSERTGEKIPQALAQLEKAEILHKDVLSMDEMEAFVKMTVKDKVARQ